MNVSEEPLVSIITPLYNTVAFIEETIESVLSQSYQNWEMIIVNDQSTDGGDAIAQRYAAQDSRIQFTTNEANMGGALTRNVAIEIAQGKYIAFLDADDVWYPEKLTTQIGFMQEQGVGFTYSAYENVDEEGQRLSLVQVPAKVSLQKMYSHNYIGCLTAVYDVTAHGKFFMPDIRKRQDFALWLTMLEKFDYAYRVGPMLGKYRIRANSLSSSKLDAIKFYWRVLRSVGGLSVVSAAYYTTKYVFLTAMKKKFPSLYNRMQAR